jgi:hypothetical protein
MREAMGKMRTFLEGKGYTFNAQGWVICERE